MRNNKTIVYLSGFLFALPIALAAYINSSFISAFISEKFIGVIYAISSSISILALLAAPKVLRKIGGYKFLLFVVLFEALSFLGLVLLKQPLIVIIVFIFGISLNTLVVFSLDEILKIFSGNFATGRTRGIYLAISSSAWVMAQVASGTILGTFSFREIYILSFLVMLCFALLVFLKLKNIKDPNYDNITNLKYIKKFLKNSALKKAYVLSFLLHFFYCWMVIYTPIYLHIHIGFSWKEIGIIFATMLLPFIFIPFPLGRYSDKIGERSMLIMGFTIISLATVTLFFIHKPELWIWALVLFTSRIGASSIEVMCDSYFFKHIQPENEEFVGFYRTASPVAYVVGPLIASMLFIFVPSFNYIYLILSTVMLSGIYLASTISKSDI